MDNNNSNRPRKYLASRPIIAAYMDPVAAAHRNVTTSFTILGLKSFFDYRPFNDLNRLSDIIVRQKTVSKDKGGVSDKDQTAFARQYGSKKSNFNGEE